MLWTEDLIYIFLYQWLLVPLQLIKGSIISLLLYKARSVTKCISINAWVYFLVLSQSHWLVFLCTNTTLFQLLSCCVILDSFFFFSQFLLVILCPLFFHINFKVSFSSFTKIPFGILIGIILIYR